MIDPLIVDKLSRHDDTDVRILVSAYRAALGVIGRLEGKLKSADRNQRKIEKEVSELRSESGWKNDTSKWGA